jgi:PAS domain S-box-containing protein
MAWLDSFLSEPLRRAPADDSSRGHVLVAMSLILGLLTISFLFLVPGWAAAHRAGAGLVLAMSLGYAGVLVLVRRAATIRLPAALMCLNVAGGLALAIPTFEVPYMGLHVVASLVPALAVYLMGPRPALILTLAFSLCSAIMPPLLYAHQMDNPHVFWALSGYAGVFLMVGWAMNWLYISSRDEAHAALHESERKLLSLVESTDDLVASLDVRGCLLTANSSLRATLLASFGHAPVLGAPLLVNPLPAALRERWQQAFSQALEGLQVRFEESFVHLGQPRTVDVSLTPIPGEDGRPAGLTLFGRDISARKQAEAQLAGMHRSLLDVSRKAGMAEIASGVLHNVGNALNSVNVSASLLAERLHSSHVSNVERAATLVREHASGLHGFLAEDPRGSKLAEYLTALSHHLAEERKALLHEVHSLTKSVEHTRSVVSMQQRHTRAVGVIEPVSLPELLNDALRLQLSPEYQGLEIRREYTEVAPLLMDRHKLLQILLNLISNALQALRESPRTDKCLTVRITPAPQERMILQVADNGVGITPGHLERLFTQGFTTKAEGHGFGLHTSALLARELQGTLSAASEGLGHGATFTLELPQAARSVPPGDASA